MLSLVSYLLLSIDEGAEASIQSVGDVSSGERDAMCEDFSKQLDLCVRSEMEGARIVANTFFLQETDTSPAARTRTRVATLPSRIMCSASCFGAWRGSYCWTALFAS